MEGLRLPDESTALREDEAVTDWNPTWQDRQGYGRDIPVADVVMRLADIPEEQGGGLLWKHIHFLATMHAENSGFMEWARPMVWKPDNVAHLSTDRGICALNSHWWSHVPDAVAYDWPDAVAVVLRWLAEEADKNTKDSRPWDWKPLLDWQWHGFGTDRYDAILPSMREAVNAERAARGITAI